MNPSLAARPKVFGILNLTPDSFSDGGKYQGGTTAVERAYQIAADGADVLDIGAESTRPGSDSVGEDEEILRLRPVLKALQGDYPIPISIDTRRAAVMSMAYDLGARILNDTAALADDPELGKLAGKLEIDVVLMHRQGIPKNMQDSPQYDHLLNDVLTFFANRVHYALDAGIGSNKLILDPGLGFGKSSDDNYILMSQLEQVRLDQYPILIGASRKSFLEEFDDRPFEDRLAGSLSFAAAAYHKSVEWLRVHDVKDTVVFLKTLERAIQVA